MTASAESAARSDEEHIWVQGQPVRIAAGRWPGGHTPRALLRLLGPVQPDWRKALAAARLTVRFWCPPTGVCVQMPLVMRRNPALLAGLAFVVGGVDFTEALCRRAELPAPADGALPPDWWDVICFDRAATARVRRRLMGDGIEVLAAGSTKLRVRFGGDTGWLRDLPGVKVVDAARAATLLSAVSIRASVGALPTAAARWQLDGAGEVIAVADTGLDQGDAVRGMHPDFAGRVRALLALPTDPSWQAIAVARADDAADRGSGHGTHVAGLACGNGQASGGRLGGIAPGAELVFLAIEQQVDIRPGAGVALASGFHLSGRPLDLRELYRAGAAHGATLHNLSWGNATRGGYDNDCYETDLYLREDPKAVIVCAAGNDGVDLDGNRRIDQGSIYAPACAKNSIAVGATEGPLLGMGPRATWADLDVAGRRWRVPADRSDAISGEPDRIAPISSSGPTRDGRIKPDLCAPGINLPSTRSRATSAQGWGFADPIPFYMYDGGTSMAAPMVSGALALVRQAWRRSGRRLSGAALKALALLACTPVRARDGGRASASEAGFGRIDVARALPPALQAVPRWRVALRDARTLKLDTGQRHEQLLQLARPARVRALLCWTDPPGERLVNDLDLSLLDADGRVLALGGAGDAPATVPDRLNPVECLDIGPLAAGRYRLRVDGFNVMDGPQRFALAWAIEETAP
jgi:subtilisin family serine protease